VKVHTLETQAILPLPRPQVFEFFSDAANLERITPPRLRFRILTPLPIEMGEGTLIDYRLSMRGVPFRWRTRIDVWQPSLRFVDRQLRGPYALWEHEHTFSEVDGGTRVSDRVRWALPLGPVGDLARGFVRWELDAIFRYREAATRECLSGASPSEPMDRRPAVAPVPGRAPSSASPRAISSGGA
jgi:ligand-binding SRPBCC domain-containing protein